MGNARWLHDLLVIGGLLVACVPVAFASADEIPKAVWKPGIKGGINTTRLTPDGTRVTFANSKVLKVVDLKTRDCAYSSDYESDGSGVPTLTEPRAAEVTLSGEYVVIVYINGMVIWRRVSDTAVISRTFLPSYPYAEAYLARSDTAVYVTSQDSGYYVSLHGIVTPSRMVLEPYEMGDSLNVWSRDLVITVVQRATGDTVTTLSGYFLGTDYAQRVYAYRDSVIVRYDSKNAFVMDTVIHDVPRYGLLTRSRFLRTRDFVIDVTDDSQHPILMNADDVLPDRTWIRHEAHFSTLIFAKPGQVVDTMYLFDGPVVSVVQDPRDSLTFVMTQGQDVMEWGEKALVGFVTDTATFLSPGGYSGWMRAPKFIRDSMSTVYATNNQVSFYGYYNLDRVRAKRSANGVHITQSFDPQDSRRPTYDFSPTGDTLYAFKGFVKYSDCPTDTSTVDPSDVNGVVGFIPDTDGYVAGRDFYETFDCDSHLELPHRVIAIAPHNKLMLSASVDSIYLYNINTGHRGNSTYAIRTTFGTWSDSGRTVRLLRNMSTIVSMHFDGSTDSIGVPPTMRRADVTWQWSNDGTVATGIKRDTLITIDVRTGSLLREYYNVPWLPFERQDYRARCVVGPVDGRLVVSLPGGSVATFPGIDLPVITSVQQASPLQPLQLQGTRIIGAIPQSIVTVYSVLGVMVLQMRADDGGSLDLADKGFPHGAYVVVFSTNSGVRSIRWLN